MTDSNEDDLAFALDVAETGTVLLVIESAAGRDARFGYARGRWCLVSSSREFFVARSVGRDAVREVVEDSDSIDLLDGRDDPAWQWFLRDGGEEGMIRAHCTCGEFMYSTKSTPVERWREKHREDCYHDPTIQYDD